MPKSPFDEIFKSFQVDNDLAKAFRDPVSDALRKMATGTDYLSQYKVLGAEDSLAKISLYQKDLIGALGMASGLDHPVGKTIQDVIAKNLQTYKSLYGAFDTESVIQKDIAPKLLRDLTAISRGAESIAFQADMFQSKLALDISGFQKSLSDLVSKQSAAFKPIADAMADILSARGISEIAGRLSALAAFPLNSLVYASLAKPVLGAGTVDLFFGSGRLSEEVGDILGRTLTALDNPEVEDPYEDLKEWFHEEIAGLKPSAANHRGFALLFSTLMFLLTILQIVLAIEARQGGKVESAWTHKHMAGIEATDKEILRKLEGLKPQHPAVEYLVMRDARLMSQPRGRGLKIGSLRPRQVVELVKRQREWICVKYLNHSSGLEVGGWVMKKYLQRVEGSVAE